MFKFLPSHFIEIRKILYPVTFLCFILFFGLSSFVSTGWLSADEHHQILEFANYKRGLLNENYLAWEFHDRIRPALQAGIAFILLNALDAAGLNDPFKQVLLLRLLSAVLFSVSALCLYRSLRERFNSPVHQYLYFICTFWLYFFPVFGVRFFSENWSACFFMLAIARLLSYRRENGKAVLKIQNEFTSGILFAFSFLFRYQSAIVVASLFLWLLIFHFDSVRRWIWLLPGFAIVFLAGIVIDRWFYGEWVLTSWNYFDANLVKGKAATFGISPWWWYFDQLIVGKWLTVLNACICILTVLFGIRRFRHPFTWLFFPFLLVHMFIGHKEMRFLYPVLVFIPFMITDSLVFTDQGMRRKTILIAIGFPLAVINCFGFVASCFRLHDTSSDVFRYTRTLTDRPIVIYFRGEQFYYTLANDAKTLSPRFYKDDHIIISREMKGDISEPLLKRNPQGDTLVYFIAGSPEEAKMYSRAVQVFSPQPEWLLKLNYRNWMHAGPGNYWKLYQIKN
jgi:phosphatidylinositol glycan class B